MSSATTSYEMKPHPSSYVDPAGKIFESNGKFLRGIRPAYADFYKSLLNDPIIQQTLETRLVKTRIAFESIEDFPLVLEHQKIEPLSYCYEWTPQMLRDAALLTLDICLALADRQLTLQDSYPWNVVMDASQPIFVDFTSITREDPHLLWVAYDQFCRFFLFPLVVAEHRSGKIMRALLLDYIDGISFEDLRSLMSWPQLLKMPWLIGSVYLPNLFLKILRGTKKEQAFTSMSARLRPNAQMRRSFFLSLRKRVMSIPLRLRNSRWSDYYEDMDQFFKPSSFNAKQAAIARILADRRPKTVVDIGCNQGGYSILAAEAGARVVSFDKDEDCISMLYRLTKERHLNILPLVVDFLCPSPSCGWRAIQFPPAHLRFHSDMAMALALVHHLAITQRQNFERIVSALHDYSDQCLVTEFVPLDDPRSKELMLTQKRDMSWYSLDNFLTALKFVYKNVETFRSYPEGRTLVLCSN